MKSTNFFYDAVIKGFYVDSVATWPSMVVSYSGGAIDIKGEIIFEEVRESYFFCSGPFMNMGNLHIFDDFNCASLVIESLVSAILVTEYGGGDDAMRLTIKNEFQKFMLDGHFLVFIEMLGPLGVFIFSKKMSVSGAFDIWAKDWEVVGDDRFFN